MRLAQQLVQTGEYRADTRSPRWIGFALAQHLNLPVKYGADNDAKDVVRLQAIIKTWIKNNVLSVQEREDMNRRKRKFIVLGSFRPEPQTDDLFDVDVDETTIQ
jgi:hypothetical protein